MDPLNCAWDTATFLIFSENVPTELVYYSHLGPLILSLLLGTAILISNRHALVNKVLFAITFFFSIWVYFDLILWASEKPEYIMFFWALIVPVELLIYASSWYLVAIFANEGKDPPFRSKAIAAATFIPILLLAHTPYNLLGFDLTNCDKEAIEGPVVQYLFLMQLLFTVWVIRLGVKGYLRTKMPAERQQLILVSLGVTLFLAVFVAGNIIVTYFLELDWLYEQYKLLGMPIFLAFITYSAIKFKAFDTKLITSQALVVASAVAVVSLLFLQRLQDVRVIAALTFALICVLGYRLVKNVKKEIAQRETIQKQEQELEIVNKQQETLLHFMSHEIKGYLTKSEAGFAAISEGDYGVVPEKLTVMAKAALTEVRKGVRTVMDILKASDMKKGTVAYKKNSFDFRKVVETIAKEQKVAAAEKGLGFEIKISDGKYLMTGDEEKVRDHVIRNLMDNAIRYSPSGTIEVRLSDGGGKIRFSVHDNGVGITPDDMARLFTEGGHGKDSIKVNVHSTGYGLFIAKQVVDAHGGKIWAESEGGGKGAAFIAEFTAT